MKLINGRMVNDEGQLISGHWFYAAIEYNVLDNSPGDEEDEEEGWFLYCALPTWHECWDIAFKRALSWHQERGIPASQKIDIEINSEIFDRKMTPEMIADVCHASWMSLDEAVQVFDSVSNEDDFTDTELQVAKRVLLAISEVYEVRLVFYFAPYPGWYENGKPLLDQSIVEALHEVAHEQAR